MEPIKVMATIDGALYEVEANQTDPNHSDFELIQDGKRIATLHKENSRWFANEEACLLPDDVDAIGKTIDENLQKRF